MTTSETKIGHVINYMALTKISRKKNMLPNHISPVQTSIFTLIPNHSFLDFIVSLHHKTPSCCLPDLPEVGTNSFTSNNGLLSFRGSLHMPPQRHYSVEEPHFQAPRSGYKGTLTEWCQGESSSTRLHFSFVHNSCSPHPFNEL